MLTCILALAKDLQAKNPLIFGAHGGSSRVSSLYGVSFSLGLMLGPLICGSLVDVAGYFYMNVIMGEATSFGISLDLH